MAKLSLAFKKKIINYRMPDLDLEVPRQSLKKNNFKYFNHRRGSDGG